jgi:hypothetical protein
MSLPDADSVTAARILLVSETKALAVPSLASVSREADLARCLGVASERSAKINGGLLEHLGGDLLSPERPVTCLVVIPSGATTNMRPALSLGFQRLNALIKSNPDQGTATDMSMGNDQNLWMALGG